MIFHPDSGLSREERLQKIWAERFSPEQRAQCLRDAEARGVTYMDLLREVGAQHDAAMEDPVQREEWLQICREMEPAGELATRPGPAPEKGRCLMTIGELLVLYERNHVAFLKNRLGTSRRLHTYVGRLANIQLADLTKMQVLEWFHAIGQTTGGTAANLALQQLHAMYVKAQDWELYDGKNPADRIKKFPKHSRERFVQANELPWLLKALADERPSVENFFLCLLLTGARRDEARLMQWKDLDLERALWHKPTTKTGVPHTIPLPAQLVTRLRALPRVCDWVFPSTPNSLNGMRAGLWSVTAVEHAWQKIRRRVGLTDVRIHDLRRTAASWLAINGSNLPVIQQMLNHRSLSSTQVYARLSVAPVRLALDDQAERMLGPVPVPVVVRPSSNGEGLSVREQGQEWPG